MMKKLIPSILIGAAVLTSGCATQTGLIQKNNKTVPTSSVSQPFFFWGIAQEKTTDAAQICGSASNVVQVQTKQEPLDVVLGVVTFGIYAPRTAMVYCK